MNSIFSFFVYNNHVERINKIMNGKKLLTILEAVATIVVGVLIAIYKEGAMGTYFGIIFVVSGSVLLLVELFALIKLRVMTPAGLISGAALLAIGIGLLISYLHFGWIVAVFVLLLIAAGSALVLYGVYSAIKISAFVGVGEIIVGALFVLFGVLYIKVPDFRTVFWIVVGVLTALSGLYLLLVTLFTKANKKDDKVIEQK